MANIERETYEIFFYKMVSKVAEDFTAEECQKLCFIFQQQISRSFCEKHSQNPLKLLNYLMQETKLFSADKPDKFAKLMHILDFPNKKNTVEAFLGEYRGIISTFYPSRSLPPLPTTTILHDPTEEEGDDLYMTMESLHSSYQQNIQCTSTTAEHVDCQPSSTMSSSSDQSYCVEDDGYGIYAEPYTDILICTSQEYFPLLEERMKLLVNPMKDIITRGKRLVVKSHPFSCPLPKCNFILEIDSGSNSCISAKLYLQPGPQESSPPLYYYQVELQVKQHSKKHKHTQNIYSHMELLDYPLIEPQQPKASPTEKPNSSSSKEEKQTLLKSHYSLLEEQTQHQYIPVECNDKGGGRASSLVASFPSIISHRNLMNEKLVKGPYLTFIFTLRQYRHEEQL